MKRRRDNRQPWNRMNVKLELYVSPELKLRLGLAQRTTEEALEEQKGVRGRCEDCGAWYDHRWIGTTCTACDGLIGHYEAA